jgi:putative ABC transport system permease protein
MRTFSADLRYAIRILRRSPGSTLIAAVTLALGVAGTTTLFSVVYGVLLRPLPYPQPDRIVTIWQRDPAHPQERIRVTPANVADWRDQARVFEDLAFVSAWQGASTWNLVGRNGHERVVATETSASFFRVFGIAPLLGRVFQDYEDDPGHAPTVVISYAFWQRHFDGDPQVIGRSITIDSYRQRASVVVGVMPPGFDLPDQQDVWLPMGYSQTAPRGSAAAGTRCCPWLHVVARMKPGVSLRQAQAEMDVIADRIARAHPEVNFGNGVEIVPLQAQMVGSVRTALWLLFGAVGCVLLIACVNVANLQLAKAASRRREVAIRTAIGARSADIIRQMLIESLALSVTGGAAGLLLAIAGVRVAGAVLAGRLPHIAPIQIDWIVLGFSVALSLLTGILFGLAPAWQASNVRPQEALKQAAAATSPGRAHARTRALLVIGEIALALVLLGGASLLVRSLLRLQTVDPGFRRDHLLIVEIDTSSTAFDGPGPSQTFFDQLVPRVAALPGVEAVSGNLEAPMAGDGAPRGFGSPVTREGQPFRSTADTPRIDRTAVMPGYFRALGIPLLKGRDFTIADGADRPNVAIISATTAARLWPGEDPVGKRFSPMTREDLARRRGMGTPAEVAYFWTEVVGVVGDVRHAGLGAEARPLLYVPYRQFNWHVAQLLARTTGDPLSLAAAVRAEVTAVHRAAIVTRVQTMDDAIGASIAQPRLGAMVVGLFATIGLLLAALGLYGVMSHGVVSRTREIGIRLALGAPRGSVLALILRQGLLLTVAGATIGAIGLALASRVVSSVLYATSPADPVALTGTIALLLTVALAAAYVPARRATRVDPLVALRDD